MTDSARNWRRMCPLAPERAPEPDLRASLENRDDHHVCDPDAADEERDGAEAEDERRERRLRGRPCFEGVGRPVTSTSSGCAGLAVAPSTRRRWCESIQRSLTRTEWAEFIPDRPYRQTCPSH
jgi:hypothetical protein